MRFIFFLFLVLVVASLIMFVLLQNAGHTIGQVKIFTVSFYEVNLVMVMFTSFVFGLILGFLFPVLQYMGSKAETRRLRRETNNLRRELDGLRNVGIEGEIEAVGSSSLGGASDEGSDLPTA